jgi:heat shock protein HslJ
MKPSLRSNLGWLGLVLLQPLFIGCGQPAAEARPGWQLAHMEVAGRTKPLPAGFHVSLDAFDETAATNRLSGFAGVNSFGCQLVRSNGHHHVRGPVVATRRGASAEFMALEAALLKVIDGGVLRSTNRILQVSREDTVLRFEPKP